MYHFFGSVILGCVVGGLGGLVGMEACRYGCLEALSPGVLRPWRPGGLRGLEASKPGGLGGLEA